MYKTNCTLKLCCKELFNSYKIIHYSLADTNVWELYSNVEYNRIFLFIYTLGHTLFEEKKIPRSTCTEKVGAISHHDTGSCTAPSMKSLQTTFTSFRLHASSVHSDIPVNFATLFIQKVDNEAKPTSNVCIYIILNKVLQQMLHSKCICERTGFPRIIFRSSQLL